MIEPPINPPEYYDERIYFDPPYDYSELEPSDIADLTYSLDPLRPSELADPLLAAEMIECGEIMSFDKGLTYYLTFDVDQWIREREEERDKGYYGDDGDDGRDYSDD